MGHGPAPGRPKFNKVVVHPAVLCNVDAFVEAQLLLPAITSGGSEEALWLQSLYAIVWRYEPNY